MSIAKARKQDAFEFEKLDLYVQDRIFRRFSLKTYAKFMQTGKWAQALENRNHDEVYFIQDKEITIQDELVYIHYEDGQVGLSFELCEKLEFPNKVDVSMKELTFTKKTCDFLLTLGEIRILRCAFQIEYEPHVDEFFKKAKIEELYMTTLPNLGELAVFPYDTSNIDYVDIDNKKRFPCRTVFQIKARKHLCIRSMIINPRLIYNYLEEAIRGPNAFDLTVLDLAVAEEDSYELANFFVQHGNYVGRLRFHFTRPHEDDPFLRLLCTPDSMVFRVYE